MNTELELIDHYKKVLKEQQDNLKKVTLINHLDIDMWIQDDPSLYYDGTIDKWTSIPHSEIESYTSIHKMFGTEPSLEDMVKEFNKLKKLMGLFNSKPQSWCNYKDRFIFFYEVEGYKSKKYNRNVRKLTTEIIYLAQDSSGEIKIGKTNNIKTRIKTLRTGNSNLKLINSYPVIKRYNEEKRIHDEFAVYRTNGEFFNVPVEEVEVYIEMYCNVITPEL